MKIKSFFIQITILLSQDRHQSNNKQRGLGFLLQLFVFPAFFKITISIINNFLTTCSTGHIYFALFQTSFLLGQKTFLLKYPSSSYCF